MSLPPLPDGATLDENLPPLPEGARLDELPPLPEGATLDEAPAEPSWGFTAGDISTEVATQRAAELETNRRARNERIRLAFDESRRVTDDDAATTVAIARKLNVPFDTVRANLPAFKETAAAANFDPEVWATTNPEFAKLVTENPELGPLVMRSKEAGPIVKALRAAGDWLSDAVGVMSARDIKEQEDLAAQMAEDPDAALRFGQVEQDARVRKELARAKRDAPQQVLERDDARAKLLRESDDSASKALILWQRAAETKQALDLSRKQVRLMLAENGFGGDPVELAAEVHDAKLAATPRAFGDDSGLMRDLSEAMQGAVSTVDVAADAVTGLGVGAGVGFAVGAGGALLASKSPGVALEAGLVTARVLGGKGATAAAFLSATSLETGSSYEASGEIVTDANKRLTSGERMGLAVVEGVAKGALEVVSLGQQGKVLKAALPETITGLVKRDPTFRALLGRVAVEYGKSIATEGGTEAFQDAIEQVGDYVAASLKDGELQKRAVLNLDRTAQAFQGGVLGATLTGGVTSTIALATTRTADAKAEVTDRVVGPVLDLAQQPIAKAAPKETAALVTEATGAKAFYADAKEVVRFFQEKGDDVDTANATVAELLGPEAPTKLAEAVASGALLEVPMEAAVSKWGASELGIAMREHTTTDPGGLTPAQRKAQQAEIDARAQAILQGVEEASADAELLARRTAELEQQLVGLGIPKREAKDGAALVRAYMATRQADFDQALKVVFPETPLSFNRGDEQAITDEQRLNQEQTDVERQDLGGRLMRAAQELEAKPAGRSVAFMDNLTGMRNLRGFALVPVKPGERLVAVTSTDTKPLNDNKQLGHEQANRMLRAIGQLMVRIDPEAGRGGTNFVGRAGERTDEEVAKIVADWRAELNPELQALNVSVAFGTNLEDALGALEERVDAGRAKGRQAKAIAPEETDAELLNDLPDAPELPAAREDTKLKLEDIIANPAALAMGDVMPRTGETPQDVQTAAQQAFADTADFAIDQLMDKPSTPDGMEPLILNKKGFEAAGPRAWTMAFDGIGLKALNAKFAKIGRDRFGMTRRQAAAWGKKQGDVLLKAIALAAHKMGGAGMAFARLSGDEFAAKHDDQAALLQFGADLMAAVEELSAGLSVKVDASTEVKVDVGIRWGLGDTYETADQDLNARKRGERGTGPGRDADLPGRGTADERAGRAERRGVLPASRLRDGQARRAQEVTRLEQDDGNIPKGYTSVPAGRALQSTIRVFLNKLADISTVIHEAGHAFLEQEFDLAERPDAPQRVKDNVAAILKAFKVDSRKQVTRKHHEQFARAFEAYTFEGKAPSGALKKTFARFTRWLVGIYRTLSGIPGTELSAELKPIFDAMLATEDQLAAVRRKQGPQLTAEQLQIKAEERQAQLEQEADEYREGSHAAQLAAVKDALRQREAWWKKGLKQLEKAFADEYEALPARQAQRLISGEETGEPIILDRKLVQEVIGEARVPGLKTVETGGVRPSLVAEMAGYASPRAMLAELAGLRSKDVWVRAQAEAEMRRLHPGILDDVAKFRGMLADGLRSATEKRLMREVQGLDREAIKRAAEKLVERRVVGKLQPGRALSQQRAAANAKARAMAKGDAIATREAAQAELLNHYLYAELQRAEAEVAKVEALAKRLGKTSAIERLGKASPAYRDAVAFIRGAFGFGPPTELSDATIEAAIAQLEGDAVTIGDPDWVAPLRAAIAKTDDYQQLTVAELGAVRDALRMLDAGARQRTEVLVDGQRMDFEQVKADVLKEIASTLPERGPIVSEHQKTFGEKMRSKLSALDGYLLSVVDFVRDLTGDNADTALHRALINTMRRAQGLEADLLEQRIKPVLELVDAMPAEVRAGLNDGLDSKAMFPNHRKDVEAPRKRYELLGLALNAGSESSRGVLLEGRGITEGELLAALNTLSKEEIDFVNAVHASLEQLREPAFALEERETGIRPRAVEALPTNLKNGRLTGGYYPLKAEPEASTVGARQFGEDQLAGLFDPTFSRPSTSHGHLKSRTGATYPLSLDLDVMRKHLLQVAHDIAYRETVKSVARLIMDPDVQRELTGRLGPEKTKEFLLWLKDIGGASGLSSTPADSIMSFFKKNLSTSALSGLSTAIGNFANLAASVTSTKLKSKHLAAGIAQVSASPFNLVTGTSTAHQRMLELSGVARAENSELLQHLQQEFVSIRSGRLARASRRFAEAGLWAMRGIDAIVSTAVWTGAHRQALAEGMDPSAAIRFADDILLRVQPSKSIAEKSRILRDKGTWVGTATIFYSYLNVAYRSNHRLAAPLFTQAFRDADVAQKAGIAAKVAGGFLAFAVAFQVLGDLGMGRGPEEGDRDEEEPESDLLMWRNWLVRKVAVAPLSTIPVLPLTSIVEGALLDKQVSPRAEPTTAMLFQFGKLAKLLAREEEVEDRKLTEAILPLVGAFTGWPTRFFSVSGGYLIWDVAGGGREVPNAGRFVGGAIYGEKDGQPLNVPAALGDLTE